MLTRSPSRIGIWILNFEILFLPYLFVRLWPKWRTGATCHVMVLNNYDKMLKSPVAVSVRAAMSSVIASEKSTSFIGRRGPTLLPFYTHTSHPSTQIIIGVIRNYSKSFAKLSKLKCPVHWRYKNRFFIDYLWRWVTQLVRGLIYR